MGVAMTSDKAIYQLQARVGQASGDWPVLLTEVVNTTLGQFEDVDPEARRKIAAELLLLLVPLFVDHKDRVTALVTLDFLS